MIFFSAQRTQPHCLRFFKRTPRLAVLFALYRLYRHALALVQPNGYGRSKNCCMPADWACHFFGAYDSLYLVSQFRQITQTRIQPFHIRQKNTKSYRTHCMLACSFVRSFICLFVVRRRLFVVGWTLNTYKIICLFVRQVVRLFV